MPNKNAVFSECHADVVAALLKAVEIFTAYSEESLRELMRKGSQPVAAVGDEGCPDTLLSVACLCANTFIHAEVERKAAEAEELTRILVAANPFPYVMFDENCRAIDCNNAAMELFQCPHKQYVLEHYWDRFSAATQPDGQESLAKAKALLNEVMTGGRRVCEWFHQTLGGKPVPTENTVTPAIYRGRNIAVSFKRDLRGLQTPLAEPRRKNGPPGKPPMA